jgi:ketosteroid isomerase-like protein
MDPLEVVRSAYADYGRGGPLRADPRWWHERLELDEGDAFPDSTVVRGRMAVAERLQERHLVSGGTAPRVLSLKGLGRGQVLVHLEMDARGRRSGLALAFEWWHLVTVRDDRIVRVRDFPDAESAMAAAGSS